MKKLFAAIVILFVASMAFASYSGTFKDLSTVEQNGKAITAELFKDYDVTFVNVFTTWCPWCIKEMPDLIKFHDNLPKGANFVLMCNDAFDAADDYKAIVDTYKIKFPVIKMTEKDFSKYFFVMGYPTTLVVANDGTILDFIMGAKSYDEYMELLNIALEYVRSKK